MDRSRLIFPMLAKAKEEIFDDPKWLFEPKIDGIRCICYITPEETVLVNRGMNFITEKFPDVQIALHNSSSAIIDGEICIFDGEIPNFQLMQTRMNRIHNIEEYAKAHPSTFIGFDLLELDGKSLLDVPLIERKNRLIQVMYAVNYQSIPQYRSYPLNHIEGNGIKMMKQLDGWEGVMAKKLISKYDPGYRSANWLKIKPRKYIKVYVLGCTAGIGKRKDTFGGLLIAIPDKKESKYWQHLGFVGTGFTDEQGQRLFDTICSRRTVTNYLPRYDIVQNMCEPFPIVVSYIEKTNDNKLRFPVYEGGLEDL